MKILLINSFYYPDIIGGAEVSVQKLAEGLVKKGHDVYVLSSGNRNKEIINGVNIITLPFNNFGKNNKVIKKVSFKVFSIRNNLLNEEIREIISSINPDIVHCNNLYNISSCIWKVITEFNIPIVQTLRDYFFICHKSTLLCNKKTCANNKITCLAYQSIMRKRFKNITYFTAPSKYTMEKFLELNMFSRDKSKVIYNAIDRSKYTNNEIIQYRLEKNEKKVKFCFLGSLAEHKGIKLLVDIVKDTNIELNIAGDGTLKKYIEDIEKNNKNIKYYGKLSEVEVEKFLLESDVLIVPSLWNEPFGRVVIDAYKFGLPVIVSNMGGLPEIVDNYKTGLIYEANDEFMLKECINKMSDRIYIKRMISDCVNKVEEFSIKNQIKQFEDLYKEAKQKYAKEKFYF